MSDDTLVRRRDVLRAVGGAAVVGGMTGAASAAGTDERERFESWFSDVGNYEGLVDRTGESTVRVAVGAAGNGGAFAFGPAAVRVDPGTTVVWEWTGEGGTHNVVDEGGAFASPMAGDAGATFERAFESAGVVYYACAPHKSMGMKGAVVVGDAVVGSSATDYPEPAYGDWFADTANFDGTVDATGVDEVRVAVGETDGGDFGFTPAAVRVDPGTTVVWEYAGPGDHDVRAADGSYASGPLTADGDVFGLTFDGDGVSTYECATHADAGMRGAVVVGAGGSLTTSLTPLGAVGGGGLVAAVLGALGYGLYLHGKTATTGTSAIPTDPDLDRGSPRP